jgi:hypothetical protein
MQNSETPVPRSAQQGCQKSGLGSRPASADDLQRSLRAVEEAVPGQRSESGALTDRPALRRLRYFTGLSPGPGSGKPWGRKSAGDGVRPWSARPVSVGGSAWGVIEYWRPVGRPHVHSLDRKFVHDGWSGAPRGSVRDRRFGSGHSDARVGRNNVVLRGQLAATVLIPQRPDVPHSGNFGQLGDVMVTTRGNIYRSPRVDLYVQLVFTMLVRASDGPS